MDGHGLTEADAFRFIQKTAMDTRSPCETWPKTSSTAPSNPSNHRTLAGTA